MPDSIQFKESGDAFTMKATAAVTGKRFVRVSGNRTGGGAAGLGTDLANVYQGAMATAGSNAVGVAKTDAANGALFGVHAGPGLVVPVESGAAIAFGQKVQSDATGRAIPWDGTIASIPLGTCMTAVGAAGADSEIKLSL